jgi:ABC-type nitrate/sulfonate/bicarbonate transport system permease component
MHALELPIAPGLEAAMRTGPLFYGLLFLILWTTACAAGANELTGVPNPEGLVAGFWRGLWHGLIAPITFVVSLFSDGVRIYEVHNNGGWYNFGFLLGAATSLGGSGGGAAHRARRR